jgi:uncharacterized protein with NRDE domain
MCLVALALHARAETALVVAANRDELYGRPSAPLGFWPGAPFVLAGRDLSGGGTWMGITRGLRFAALTNVRDPASMRSTAPSRGLLVSEYLLGAESPAVYLRAVAARAAAYNPFNLLAGDLKSGELLLLESRDGAVRPLPPGLYGLSNASLDTPWPKLVRLREALRALLERAAAPSPRGAAGAARGPRSAAGPRPARHRRRPRDRAGPRARVHRDRALRDTILDVPDRALRRRGLGPRAHLLPR